MSLRICESVPLSHSPLHSRKLLLLIAVPSGGQSRVRSLMLLRFAQSAYRFTPLTAHLFAVLSATPKKGTVEAKASTALFRLPIVPQKPPALVCGSREYLQGLCPLHPQPPLGTVEGFAPFPSIRCDDVRQSENAVKGLRVEIFRQKNTTRPLTEWSDTLPSQRGKQTAFPSCHTASVGCGATPHT